MQTKQSPTRIDSGRQEVAATVIPNYVENVHIANNANLNVSSFTDKFFKKTAFITLASLPTIVQPIIETPSDTLISTERPFIHSVVIGSPHNRSGVDLSVALDGYEVKGLTDIENYLNRNDDLLKFLSSLPASIYKSESVESVELEFYHDIEEHWEKLFVVVNTQIDDMDELNELEDSLYSSLFEPNTDTLSGRVVLSIG